MPAERPAAGAGSPQNLVPARTTRAGSCGSRSWRAHTSTFTATCCLLLLLSAVVAWCAHFTSQRAASYSQGFSDSISIEVPPRCRCRTCRRRRCGCAPCASWFLSDTIHCEWNAVRGGGRA
eukprot:scaffold13215_cov120-Isochrysis_galbana.AAC.5